jgi:FAD-linked sulfhydryl oxidase
MIVCSLRLCHIHNLVNSRLKKAEFDCTKLDETYDCGCGDPPLTSSAVHEGGEVSDRKEPTRIDKVTGLDMIKGGIGR